MTIEPRIDTKTYKKYKWPKPQISKIIANEIILGNNTHDIVHVNKNEHICQIRAVIEQEFPENEQSIPLNIKPRSSVECKTHEIVIDPNKQLNNEWKKRFQILHEDKRSAFVNKIGHYNDHSGKVRARVNISVGIRVTLRVIFRIKIRIKT